jgi:O-antigen ligase
MNSQDWLYLIFTSRYRWLSVLATLVLCAALAIGVGYLLAEFGPLIAVAGLAAVSFGLWMLRDIEVAYWAVIGVVCLLPFASFPFDVGFTPTLLDGALGGVFFIWALQVSTGAQRTFIGTPLGVPIGVFMLLAMGSFVFGLAHAPLTSYVLRHFAEVLLSVALFFLVVNTVRDKGRLRRIVRALLLCAFAAAALGIVLYIVAAYISEDLVIRALSTLGRLGYPTGPGVLRYIREDPELPMRATATSVDPNVLGSLLNLTLGVGVPQLFARQPLIRRRYLVPMLATIALCLGLTISRGSLVGIGGALAVVATLRYRRLWLFLLLGVVLLVALPQTQGYVAHFIEGIRIEDLATQMRMGEYKDAFILIGRYPWLGVGFAGSPDIDTYLGVSNVYLLIAEQMGLIGLASFFVVMGVFFLSFWRARSQVADNPELEPLWWGLHAGVMGALIGGVFDHYFFNPDFHHSVTLFWLVVGLAMAATDIIRSERENNGEDVQSSVLTRPQLR